MWLQVNGIVEREFEDRNGKPYTCFELSGIKKGWMTNPDAEWSRKLFKNQATTVIENGVERPGIGIVSFFQKAVKPGDTVSIKQVRNGSFWDIVSVENITGKGGAAPAEYTTPTSMPPASSTPVAPVEDYEPAPWADAA